MINTNPNATATTYGATAATRPTATTGATPNPMAPQDTVSISSEAKFGSPSLNVGTGLIPPPKGGIKAKPPAKNQPPLNMGPITKIGNWVKPRR